MAELKRMTEAQLRYLAGEKGFNLIYLEKDYFLTMLLFYLKDIKGIVFKGGTALNKIFLCHKRLSEDLDFSCTRDIQSIKNEIEIMLKDHRAFFPAISFDNMTEDSTRMIIRYKGYFQRDSSLILDLNRKASVILEPSEMKVPHFYELIPEFTITTLCQDELVAEKVRAMITRNQPRDYFDVYMIISRNKKIDMDLVRSKVKEAQEEFSIERIFRNARKIYSMWEQDIGHLTNEFVDYHTVVKALKKEFKYKT